ncbi:hypothetical protein P7C71_g1599, partial [Lecanoromycetidae sp. Uapishka_2]
MGEPQNDPFAAEAEKSNESVTKNSAIANPDTDQVKKLENTINELQLRIDRYERGPISSPASAPWPAPPPPPGGYMARNDPFQYPKHAPWDSSSESEDADDWPSARRENFPSRRRHRPSKPGNDSKNKASKPEESEDESKVKDASRPKLDIVRWKQTPTAFGDPIWEKEGASSAAKNDEKDFSKKSLLTVIREFDDKKQFWRRSIEILSPVFPDLLEDVSQYHSDVALVDGELRLTEPLMVLFHNRKRLTDIADGTIDKSVEYTAQGQEHAKFILDFMRTDFPDVTKKYDELESASPSGLISYPELWMLYKPGTIVYTTENGEHEAFVIESIRGMQKRQRGQSGRHGYTRLDLVCWSIDYDGEIFGRVWSTHCILAFHDAREIKSLDLVPEKFLPEAAKIKSSLISRGKNFWLLQGQKYREYTGEMWSQNDNSEEAVRVMVDHLTYQRRNSWPITIDRKRGPSQAQSKNWRDNRFIRDNDRSGRRYRISPNRYDEDYYSPERVEDRDDLNRGQRKEPYKRFKTDRPPHRADSNFNRYDVLQPTEELDELAMLLCPQQVHGYCLRDRLWKNLNVTQLRDVSFRANAWDRLVLDAEYKDIVRAMVSSYIDKTAMLDDLVAGKGVGLCALLHGPPGSGKTLTAECVAESFEKPLYQVTCGDIGTDPEGLEERLEEIFDYAHTFGAVLLLDEADIFLQDRDYQNLERNALVSIFLRTLEYFKGVLFLTTNRVGIFDQAFQSRIHVTLGLPSLDQDRRISVWSIFMQDLASKGVIGEDRYVELMRLVKEKWSKDKLNGRQIRNAVRTSLVVAQKNGVVVGESEFETVLRISREFETRALRSRFW